MSAIGQPASILGIITVLSGESIAALSAMKCTPQKTITLAGLSAAAWLKANESPVISATACTSSLW